MATACYSCRCAPCQCACSSACSTPVCPTTKASMTNNNNGTYTFFDTAGNSVSLNNIVDFATLSTDQVAALCFAIATCIQNNIVSNSLTFAAPLVDAAVPIRTLYVTDGSTSGFAAETLVYKDESGAYHNLEV